MTAVVLIAFSSIRFAAAGLSYSRAGAEVHRRRSRDVSGLRQAAEVARLNSELQSSSREPAGIDWRVLEVAEIVDESEDCRSFYLIDPYGEALPDFRPGQHLLVRPALAGSFQTVRCYSLSSHPNPKYWRITVKREQPPKRMEHLTGGGLSQWLHDSIRQGDCLLVGGPNGQFHLNEATRPVVLLAAGIGITPMASMLRWILEHQAGRPVGLFYQARDTRHWPLGAVLHQWQANCPKLSVCTYFSRESMPEFERLRKTYPGRFEQGKIQLRGIAQWSQDLDCDFYICGPNDWMQFFRDALSDAGVAGDRVHWESFGSANANSPTPAENGIDSRSVRFQHSDVETEWQDPQQTIWELARENDVILPSGCLSGVCGCCRVKLLAGAVEYDRSIALAVGG